MGTTPTLALPYPEAGDPPAGNVQIKALADRLDLIVPDTPARAVTVDSATVDLSGTGVDATPLRADVKVSAAATTPGNRLTAASDGLAVTPDGLVIFGSAAPVAGTGYTGQLYVATSTGAVYQKVNSTTWTQRGTIAAYTPPAVVWNDLSLASGFVADSAAQTPQYAVSGGFVFLRGAVKKSDGTSVTATSTFGSLPGGSYPTGGGIFPVALYGVPVIDDRPWTTRVTLSSSGSLSVQALGSTSQFSAFALHGVALGL